MKEHPPATGTATRLPRRLASGAAVLVMALGAACSSSPPRGTDAVAVDLDRMRIAATDHVADPQRRAELLEVIDGLQSDLTALSSTYFETMTRIRALNTQADLPRAQMEQELARLDEDRRRVRDKLLDRHFQLVGLTTPAEWEKLAGFEHKALMAASR